MTTRTYASLAVLAGSLFLGAKASAVDPIIDTGPGNASTIGGLTAFNDSGSGSFQFIGMKISLAETTDIGRIDVWINGFGTFNVNLRADASGLPGTELESEPVGFSVSPSGWLTVSGLTWSVAAGDYWVTFEYDLDAGNATLPLGAPNPLSNYAFFADGNPGWSPLGTSFPMGLRVYPPAPTVPVLVPSEYATIQDAIDAVSSGQVIEVAPGTYNEAINYSGKTITIQSSDGAGVTTIDATGLGQPAVYVTPGSGAATRLDGFTIMGGEGSDGGGIDDLAQITVANCTITQNNGGDGGGAAVWNGGEATFDTCNFDSNGNEGATSTGGGLYVNNGIAHLMSCTFTNNQSVDDGGAIDVNNNATVDATDCMFASNTAGNTGGAVEVISSTASATFTTCTFDTNTAVQSGAVGVNLATAHFIGCTFTNNTATYAGITSGGGIQVQGSSTLTIDGCTFTGNHADQGAGAQFLSFSGTASITGSAFRNNVATILAGGVEVTASSTIPTIDTTEFCGNTPANTFGSFTDGGGNTFATSCTPDNNTPDNSEPIASNGGSAGGTFAGATNSGTSTCDPTGVDVFFDFTISSGPTSVLIDTCGSTADTALAVFDADDNELGCNTTCGGDPCGGPAACLTLADLDNGTYTIRVSQQTSRVAGGANEFQLEIHEVMLALPGDLNGDMVVDNDDRVQLCSTLGSSTGDGNFIEAADFDHNGIIDQLDEAAFNAILPPCLGDIVTSATFQPPPDGKIDGADLAYLLGAWGNTPSCADIVTSQTFQAPPDGKVDGADLAVLLGAWGTCQ